METNTQPKCTNERPYCQKCITSGRQCEGYERERVFITGTPETKGRVASHPKKGTPPKKQKASFGGDSRLELVPLHPLTSAWDDCISLYSHGGQFKAMVTALQTKLGNVSREELEDDSGFSVSLPPYFPHEVQPSRGEDDFETRAMCLAHLSSSDDGEDDVRSFFVYLFEVSNSLATIFRPAVANQCSKTLRLHRAWTLRPGGLLLRR